MSKKVGTDAGNVVTRHDEKDFRESLSDEAEVAKYREVLELVAGLVTPITVNLEILRRKGFGETPDKKAALDRVNKAALKIADLIATVRGKASKK